MIDKDLVTQIQIVAQAEGVPWDLMCAIAERESAGSTWALRFESRWAYFVDPKTYSVKLGISATTERTLQMFSFGLCQVMGGVARELGYQDHLIKLCAEPALGVQYGCKKMKQLLEKYQSDDKAISAYNQGIPLHNGLGVFVNQVYVDAVNEFRKQYR